MKIDAARKIASRSFRFTIAQPARNYSIGRRFVVSIILVGLSTHPIGGVAAQDEDHPSIRLPGAVYTIEFSPDDKLLAVGLYTLGDFDEVLKLFDAETLREVATLKGHTAWIRDVAFSPGGRLLASAGRDTTIKLWDVGMRAEVATLRGHAHEIWTIAFSPDGKLLASGSSDRTVKVWDVENKKILYDLKTHQPGGSAVEFVRNDSLFIAGSDADSFLWDLKSQSRTINFIGHERCISGGAVSPMGTTIATIGCQQVFIWDAKNEAEPLKLKATNCGFSVAFSPDGQTIAFPRGSGDFELYNIKTRKSVMVRNGHERGVYGLDFSQDGTRLATGSEDRILRLWRFDKLDAYIAKNPISTRLPLEPTE